MPHKINIATSTKVRSVDQSKVLLDEMKRYNEIIDHNILDNYIAQNETDKKYFVDTPIDATRPSLAVIIRKKQTHTELAQYLHSAAFSPITSTFTQSIQRNFFKTWPGLTPTIIKKHLPPVLATTQGHLHQERQNLQSTNKAKVEHRKQMEKIKKRITELQKRTKPGQTIADTLKQDINEDHFPPSPTPNVKTNNVCYAIIDKEEISTAYTDLTGRFPMRSSQGNQYVMVAYHYDANLIYGKAIKDRKAATLTDAWEHLHAIFSRAGAALNTYVMDNEISQEFVAALIDNKTAYQLVQPYTHRRNLAERAIQTFKNHFKAGLVSVDPNFPLSEWDRLLEQANITLNLLRSSRSNPAISAYTYIFGEFNFSATPLAPPGTKIVTHVKSNNRGTWELNGEVGWYVGPSMQHYRCVKCYFPRTKEVRDCDTVTFFPPQCPFRK